MIQEVELEKKKLSKQDKEFIESEQPVYYDPLDNLSEEQKEIDRYCEGVYG